MKLPYKTREELNRYKRDIDKIEGLYNVKLILNLILDESSTENVVIEAVAGLHDLVKPDGQDAPAAAFLLAYCCEKGIGATIAEEKAIRLYTFAAEKEFALAQINLGKCHFYGTQWERKRAFELITLAADQGHALGQYYLGVCYRFGTGVVENKKRAFEYYCLAANQGDPADLIELALLCKDGIGVDTDKKLAVELLFLAAKQGSAAALYELGICYRYGAGVAEDEKRAFELLTLSASQGYARAQYELGHSYQEGIGCVEDIKRSVLLYQAAKQNFHNRADTQLKQIYALHNGGIDFPELDKALIHYNDLKDKDPTALATLAFCYQMGLGTKQDTEKALGLYLDMYRRMAKGHIDKGRCNWDIYLCHRIQHLKTGEVKSLCEFYDTVRMAYSHSNAKAARFLSYLHEHAAPALPAQSLFAADIFYRVFADKSPLEQTEDLKRAIDSNDTEFEFDIDMEVHSIKLEHFWSLFLLEAIIQQKYSISGIARIIAEYAFEHNIPNTSSGLRNTIKLSSHIKSELNLFKKYLEKIKGLPKVKEVVNTILDEPSTEAVVTKTVARLQPLMKYKGKEAVAATCLLGFCYDYEIGVARDTKRGFELSTLAANQGFAPAQYNLVYDYDLGSHNVAQDVKRAFELCTLAAKQGYEPAQGTLGHYYDLGIGVARDRKQSVECYTLAASQGLSMALYHLGIAYSEGCGVDKDRQRAALLLGAAEKLGVISAIISLREFSGGGQYFPELDEAIKYYNDHKHQDPSALNTLAFCYQMGLGVPPDVEEALSLYRKMRSMHKRDPNLWDIYMCLRIQHQNGGDLKSLSEFYERIDSACQKGNAKAKLFSAYLHEYAAPGLPSQSLFMAHRNYLAASVAPKDRALVDSAAVDSAKADSEVEFEIEIDIDTPKKLVHFTPLFVLQVAVQEAAVVPRNIADIISDYAFDEDMVVDIESIMR